MKCSKCGRENRDDASYCFACKTPLSVQGYSPQPVVDESPIYHTEYERTDKYYEEPSPYEPEDPIYSKEPEPQQPEQQQQEQRSVEKEEDDDEDIEEFFEYYVPEDVDDDDPEDEVAIYEAEAEDEDDVELKPLFAEDLEEEEEGEEEKESSETAASGNQQTVPIPRASPPPPPPEPPEEPPKETEPLVTEPLVTEPLPVEEGEEETNSSASEHEVVELQEMQPLVEEDEDEDDGDFVISTPKPKPVIVFDDDDDEDEDDDEDVLFDDSEDEDFEIVPSRKIDPKMASNIALIQTIMSRVNNLKKTGRDVKRLEEKMGFVLTCRDEDKKLILAKSCLEDIDKLDKETDQEIFEETAGKFHAMRARLIVLAKKGRDVNHYSDLVEDASQAISLCDFTTADRIITDVMAELERY